MPAVSPLLANNPESWTILSGHKFAHLCVGGVDHQCGYGCISSLDPATSKLFPMARTGCGARVTNVQQLLWGVNITIRRKLTLMLLFSGAVFIIIAGTIRAVTILTVRLQAPENWPKRYTDKFSQSGPDGAVSGSLWACRETFVAIIVTNLPIIHPLIRQIAKAIGLGALLSRNSRSRSQSYPLQSGGIENQKGASRKTHAHPLSIPNDTAWASDEHILPMGKLDNSTSKEGGGGIVVAQEVSVRSEAAGGRNPSPESGRLRGDDWGFQASAGGSVPQDRV